VTQAIHVMARLGIADILHDGPLPPAAIAAQCEADPEALHRLLRALEGIGIVRVDDDGRYASTPLGDLLRRDHPQSVWAAAELVGDPLRWDTWEDLYGAITTGTSSFERVHGMPLFAWLGDHADLARRFDNVMTMSSRHSLPSILDASDFSRSRVIVDVGGGQGALLRGILHRYPAAQGILFDQPHVVDEAREIARTPEADRCIRIGGDMFAEIPPGGDTYILRRILHDWNDPQVLTILRNCRDVISPDGRLLVMDAVVPDGGGDAPEKWNDLHMLLMCGGKERTREEFAALFQEAGFVLADIRPAGGISILEGRPAWIGAAGFGRGDYRAGNG
jgi:SAM-dependent methyltransferase